ncbi:hypothetical protein FOB31_03460 [Burkholderia multivorans]|nr:hypothetical protein FOB31_03460 [Burkholderia multivorans]QET40485.1 hypothetical protein FOB30_22915 [Burkholderia multivorans]
MNAGNCASARAFVSVRVRVIALRRSIRRLDVVIFLLLRYPDRFAIVRHCYTRHQTDRDRPHYSPKRCH